MTETIMRSKYGIWIVAVVSIVTGCSADGTSGASKSGSGDPLTGTAATTSVSVARQIVALNNKLDKRLNLVARKYLNNETEVAEFYEPTPGRILFSSAGSPVQASVLHQRELLNKTPFE